MATISTDDPLRTTRRIVIVNTVLCVMAIIPAFAIQLGTVMGGAAPGAGELGSFIAMAGLLLPALPFVSIIGSWLTLRWRRVALGFVLLPWVYGAVLCGAVLVLFSR